MLHFWNFDIFKINIMISLLLYIKRVFRVFEFNLKIPLIIRRVGLSAYNIFSLNFPVSKIMINPGLRDFHHAPHQGSVNSPTVRLARDSNNSVTFLPEWD